MQCQIEQIEMTNLVRRVRVVLRGDVVVADAGCGCVGPERWPVVVQ